MSDFQKALISNTQNNELQGKLNLFSQFIGDWDFEGIYRKDT